MRLSAQKVRKVIKKNAGQRDKYYLFERENKREKWKTDKKKLRGSVVNSISKQTKTTASKSSKSDKNKI